MKKVLFVLCLALLLTLVCTNAMAAIDPKYKANGKSLSEYESKGSYNGEALAATNPIVITHEPTCEKGSAQITTIVKSYPVELDAIHTLGPKVVRADPTDCTKQYADRTCTACGATVTTYENSGKTHKFVNKPMAGSEATCKKGGMAESRCEVCNMINPSVPNPFETAAVDHLWEKKVIDVEETCYTKGQYHKECIWCGEPYKEGGVVKKYDIPVHAIEPNSHYVVEEEATCTKEGKRYLVCAKCGLPKYAVYPTTIDYEVIPKTEHQFGEWVVKVPATCKDGEETRSCPICNTVETRVIAGTGLHTWITTITSTDASCAKNGDGTAKEATNATANKVCSVCGEKKTEAYTEKFYGLHQFVSNTSKVDIPPECVNGNPGKKFLICVKCNGTYTESIPALKEHKFGEWVMVVAPGKDGTKNGRWERKCTNYHCAFVESYTGVTAPAGAAPVATATANATTAPTTGPSGSENYQVTSWSFNGSGVSGQVKGNVTYRTPGLGVNVIIYTPTGTFLATSTPVNDDGTFSVSAGGAVYAVSIQLKDNNKTYQTDGKYV